MGQICTSSNCLDTMLSATSFSVFYFPIAFSNVLGLYQITIKEWKITIYKRIGFLLKATKKS